MKDIKCLPTTSSLDIQLTESPNNKTQQIIRAIFEKFDLPTKGRATKPLQKSRTINSLDIHRA